jgi:uncharacterized protein YndB with AHSA1/START domain
MTPPATGPSRTEQDRAAERTIATARVIAALPEQVYAAFVSSERLARWWGPKGFRNTFQVFEPRPGGTWRFVMHGPNGGDYPNVSVFETLVPGERIVIRHVSGPRFTLTVTLAAEGAGTHVTWHQVFDSLSECEAVRRFAVGANEENLDRLESELARTSP